MTRARQTASAIESRIAGLYGDVDLAASSGVVHVTAVWPNNGDLVVIKITPHSPKSETDFFLLNLARARADVIVVTGKLLRDEPDLEYRLGGPDALGLARWRAEVAGKADAPQLLVLTSGNAVDLDHPALHGWAHPVLFTGTAGEKKLAPAAGRRGFAVVGHPSPSVETALSWAQAKGARTISIEAGPSTAAALYAPTLPTAAQIAEVMLSEYLARDLPRDLRGGTLVAEATLREQFACEQPPPQMPSGGPPSWRFTRHVRFRAPPGTPN